MKQKHIDAMREARLWLRDVIIPGITGLMIACPEARQFAIEKYDNMKTSMRKIMKKEN